MIFFRRFQKGVLCYTFLTCHICDRLFYCSMYNIMRIMLFAADFGGFFIFMLNYQLHIFHSFAVFRTG